MTLAENARQIPDNSDATPSEQTISAREETKSNMKSQLTQECLAGKTEWVKLDGQPGHYEMFVVNPEYGVCLSEGLN